MKQNETLVWVIYDISKNKIRRNVVKITQLAGLYRVQKSVFLGRINLTELNALVEEIEDIIDRDTDSVYVFPMCQPDFKKVILKGNAFDKSLVNDEIKSFFV